MLQIVNTESIFAAAAAVAAKGAAPTEDRILAELGVRKWARGHTEGQRNVCEQAIRAWRIGNAHWSDREGTRGSPERKAADVSLIIRLGLPIETEVFIDVWNKDFVGDVAASVKEQHAALDRRAQAQAQAQAQADKITAIRTYLEAADAACGFRKCGASMYVSVSDRVEIIFTDGAVTASGKSTKTWSQNGKWSGNDSSRTYAIHENWKNIVYDNGLSSLDGMLTLEAVPTDAPSGFEAWTASWARQSRGFGLDVERGVIVRRRVDGEIAHAVDTATGIRLLKRRAIVEREAFTLVPLAGWSEEDLAVTIRLVDSVRAGNCATGSKDWVAKNMPGRVVATVREVLTAAIVSGDRVEAVNRACRMAVKNKK